MTGPVSAVSVIIPANDEEAWLPTCLEALRGQAPAGGGELIVAANACTDGTVAAAETARPGLEKAGWRLSVLDLTRPGKLNALNAAEAQATGRVLVYLDADVVVGPGLVDALVAALDWPEPRYASGRHRVAPPRSWISRHYADLWVRLPFMTAGVQGAGLFAVSRAGRARWGAFPDIISDDTFVRLQFAPEERIKVSADYTWPLVEGFARLVRVRRRQDAGLREIEARYPALMANEDKAAMTLRDHLALAARSPISYGVYATILLAVRARRAEDGWARGR